jgi:ATP-dependent helicase/nuclease subunit A
MPGPARQPFLSGAFTEAAAANMKNRLLGELATWATADDASLDSAIAKITGEVSVATKLRAISRTLFATALQSPGGLKISTIHGFCTSVLQVAPIEANVPAQFTVADEARAATLLREARDGVLSSASQKHKNAALRHALARVTQEVTSDSFDKLLNDMLWRSEALMDDDGMPLTLHILEARLRTVLGVSVNATEDTVCAEALQQLPSHTDILKWIPVLDGSIAKDQKQARLLEKVFEATSNIDAFAFWQNILMTDGVIRKDIISVGVARSKPELEEALRAAAGIIVAYGDARLATATFDRNFALHLIIQAILASYTRNKIKHRVLDYADLIARTRSLFTRVSAGWVLYKLDAGIDHLLVDEAQDTNPAQWAILDALTSEFTDGIGARDGFSPPRTVFSVGDEKQSIYGFQGAEPKAFDNSLRRYKGKVRAAKLSAQRVRL